MVGIKSLLSAAVLSCAFFLTGHASAQNAAPSPATTVASPEVRDAPSVPTTLPTTTPLASTVAAPLAPVVSTKANATRPEGTRGDTAWILTCATLVVFMVFPGLSLFYGGLVRRKNVISIYAQCVIIASAAILSWVVIAYSIAFSPGGGGYIGDLSRAGLTGILPTSMFAGGDVLEWPMVVFHLSFVIITTSLVIGSFAERVRPGGVLLFGLLWPILVYAPIARWVWHPEGWLAKLGHLDWAGGTVVHVAAGFSGLAAAIVTGRRVGYGEEAMTPNHMGLTLAGAGCLLVGWMGFNGGSALHADATAAVAIVNTLAAGAAGAVTWIIIEGALRGYASGLGMASGVLGGLIAITPAAGYTTPLFALAFGALGASGGYFGAVVLKRIFDVDDTLDVFGLHGVAGVVGSIAVGLLASSQLKASVAVQTIATGTIAIFAFFATLLLVAALRALGLWRVAINEELEGLDSSQHAESV